MNTQNYLYLTNLFTHKIKNHQKKESITVTCKKTKTKNKKSLAPPPPICCCRIRCIFVTTKYTVMSHNSFLVLCCHENLQRLYKTHCHVPWYFSSIVLSWKRTKAVQNTLSCPMILFYYCVVMKMYKGCTKHTVMSHDSFLVLCCHENVQRLYKTHCHVPWFFSSIVLSWKRTKAVQNTLSCPMILFEYCVVMKT